MRFVSTRGHAPAATLSEAIRNGVAPDGGLYLPAVVPDADPALHGDMPLAAFAQVMLAPFFDGDPLAGELAAVAAEAFDFPVPLVTPDPARPTLRALELFHGPSAAFKDFGARFLMGLFDRIGNAATPLTVLVATSGDTGGAVGAAAEGRDAVRAVILYPRGRVSAFQELQLTCWAAPVRALELDGDFDDCQRLVKAAFADPVLSGRHRLTSANSINIGRLLPQMVYLAWASVRLFEKTGTAPGFIVPTGNLGHGFAAVYARAMGFPVGLVVLATNANATLADWRQNGVFTPKPSVATIANAMDVGTPSNFERLAHMTPGVGDVAVELVDDDAIRARIRAEHRASGYVWCPHSATAAEAYARMTTEQRAARSWIAAATAHPYKFADVVGPVIGHALTAPPALARILGRRSEKVAIRNDLDELAAALEVPSLQPA